mgnify:CR=1 FL=1
MSFPKAGETAKRARKNSFMEWKLAVVANGDNSSDD